MRVIVVVLVVLAGLLLSSCGGSSSPQPLRSDLSLADDNPQTAPLVEISFNGFDPETTSLRFTEGETITFRVEMIGNGVETASLSQTSGPQIDFGIAEAAGQESDGDLDTSSVDDPFRFTLVDRRPARNHNQSFHSTNRRISSAQCHTTYNSQFSLPIQQPHYESQPDNTNHHRR